MIAGRGVAGLEDVLEVEGGDAGGVGQGFELDLGLRDGAEGALGSDDDSGKVEGVRVQEFVEVVAADPAHDLGVAGLLSLRGWPRRGGRSHDRRYRASRVPRACIPSYLVIWGLAALLYCRRGWCRAR